MNWIKKHLSRLYNQGTIKLYILNFINIIKNPISCTITLATWPPKILSGEFELSDLITILYCGVAIFCIHWIIKYTYSFISYKFLLSSLTSFDDMINNIAEAKGLNKEEVLEKYKKIVSSSGYTKYKLYGICVDEKEVISIFDPLVFRRMENITEYYDPVDDKHKYKLLAVRASRPAKTQSEGGALGFNQEYVYHQLQIKKKIYRLLLIH